MLFNTPARLVSIFVSVLVLFVTLQLFQIYGGIDLRYIWSDIAHGEVWRLLSGHFIHSNWWHMLFNLLGLLLCLLLFPILAAPLRLLLVSVLMALLVSFGLYFVYPYITWYLGFSSVLHGLFIVGALLTRDRFAWMAMLIVIGKTAWEFYAGPPQGIEALTGVSTLTEAHFLGVLSGLAVGGFIHVMKS